VHEISLDELDGESPRFDALIAGANDVDRFCSSTDWILPAARGLQPGRAPWLRRGEHGYVALMVAEHAGQRWLEPLEAMWGLACPLAGEPVGLAAEVADELRRAPPGAAVMLCGLQRHSLRLAAAARALDAGHRLGLGPPARRHVASLAGGIDGFLSRRTPNFRRALKKALRRAAGEHITFVEDDDPDAGWRRLLAVEERSWKGRDGVGIAASGMLDFYRLMVPRLHRRGALRLGFAQRDGQDLAYILGGIFGDTYRGLQFSFAADEEPLSLGNLCQYWQLERLCAENIALYDLGSEVEYKRRWGEIVHETVTLVAWPA
jgi:CelD/BcsL family acetyltransferase involved in cellulose biosynthesis